MYTLKAGKCKGWTPLVMLDSLWGHSSTPSPRVGGRDLPSPQRPKKAFLHTTTEALVPGSWHMPPKLPLPGENKTNARNRRCTFCSSSPSFFSTPKLKKIPILGLYEQSSPSPHPEQGAESFMGKTIHLCKPEEMTPTTANREQAHTCKKQGESTRQFQLGCHPHQ